MPGKSLPVTVLMISRLVYSMNWYNLSPALIQISSEYGVTVSVAGLIFAFFLLGAGLFQVPAGILAARIGSRTNCIIGLSLMSVTGLVSIFTNSFTTLLVLRFLSGTGAAFYFSSAVAVLNEIYPEKLGMMMGYYNAAFDIGGGIGILGFTPITVIYGLKWNEIIQAILTAISAISLLAFIPKSEHIGNFEPGVLRKRIMNPKIWTLAIAFSGFWSTTYVFSEYMKTYATFTGLPSYYAGALGSSVLFFGILGSFFSGRLKPENFIRTAIWMVVILSFAVIWIPFLGVSGMWSSALIVGMLTVSISSLEYSTVVFIENDRRYVALNSGLFNSIQILLGFAVVFSFTYILERGFLIAWIVIGLIPCLTIPVVLLYLKEIRTAGIDFQGSGKKVS
ncbi:MAG: MFS transporter [Candidatus Thermoplasmatota archaeon]|nr:MFS transporter [Candidatus Thermoplasmatota archaeon]